VHFLFLQLCRSGRAYYHFAGVYTVTVTLVEIDPVWSCFNKSKTIRSIVTCVRENLVYRVLLDTI
jgi:hypothetical protein